MDIILAALIVIATTIGQILLKKGALSFNKKVEFRFVLFGYSLFILAVIFSFQLMKIMPLKYYTVVMSINYITVMFGAKYFLNEKINRSKVIGTALVTLGIIVFLYK